jgi:hypothetical protein
MRLKRLLLLVMRISPPHTYGDIAARLAVKLRRGTHRGEWGKPVNLP